jgi:hypothetical protein
MRKKLKAEARRTHVIQVPVNLHERQTWTRAAKSADRSLAGWLRALVNAAVKRAEEEI